MNTARRSLPMLVLAATALLFLFAAPASAQPGRVEVIIEGAAAMPRGDLKAAHTTPAGFGAEMGYDAGFRIRLNSSGGWAFSPSFHYAKFGKFRGYDAIAADYFEVGTMVLGYGADLQYFFNARGRGPKVFLTGGLALARNKMREDYETDTTFFEDGAYGIALCGGLGLRQGDFEFSVEYHRNRFETLRFWDGVPDYDWDYLTLRIGFALPRYDR